MVHIVQWQNNEQITLDDLNDIGISARDTFDYLTADAVDNSMKFAGFTITATSSSSVTVGAGRVYQGGKMFSNEDSGGDAFNLINMLPSTNGNTKVVSLVAYGNQFDSNGVARTFLTNTATNATEANSVSTQNIRAAVIATVAGAEAPQPVPPPINANYVEFARITLGYSGIVSFKYVETNRLQSVTGLDTRATALELWKTQTGAQIDTMRSDISNLANAIQGLPNPNIFTQVVRTLSQVQANAKVPANAQNFHFDYLLTQGDSSSDPTVASYLCNVQEGIRFPWAAQALGILQLLNPIEPKIKANSGVGMMLPDYAEAARIDTVGQDGTLPIAQTQFQNLVATQKSISRTAIQYGTTFTVCQNSLFWQTGTYDPITGIFTRNGETYKRVAVGIGDGPGHRMERLQQFWTTTQTDTYTEYDEVTTTVSGSTKSQTFLNSQAGWCTSVEMCFGQVAATGDITLLLCDTANGAPDPTSVLGQVKVAAADLKTYPTTTKFPLTPVYLDAGKRYGVILITSGNHFVSYVSGNKYAQGSLFDSTDQAWFQGDLDKDLAMRVNFAKFTSTVCQVQLQPLSLQNGITDIQLIFGSKIPDGCELVWEFQKGGIWYTMEANNGSADSGAAPLLGLPPLLPLRVTYVGTTDLMPGIDMTQTQTLVSRPGAAFQHWTQPIVLGITSSAIRVEVTVDAFDPNAHAVASTLMMADNSIVNPSSVSTAPDPNGATDRFIKTYTYSLGTPTANFRIGISGTTNAVTDTYHVESRFDYES